MHSFLQQLVILCEFPLTLAYAGLIQSTREGNKLENVFRSTSLQLWSRPRFSSMAVSQSVYLVSVLATLTFLVSAHPTSNSATETSLTATPDASCFSPVINNQVRRQASSFFFFLFMFCWFSIFYNQSRSKINRFYKKLSFIILIHILRRF